MVDHIAAEQFVRPFSGENDLDMFRGLAVHKVQSRRGSVRQGLIHEILDPGVFLPVLLGGDNLAVVFDPDFFRERLRVGNLIIFLIVETDCKGLRALEIRGDIGRIHAARQQGGDLHIADHMVADRLLHRAVDLIHDPFVGGGIRCLPSLTL